MSPRPLAVLRLAYGLALCLAPGRLLTTAGLRSDRPARVFARVLGARHLAQAAAASGDGRTVVRLGAGVDAVHAISAAAWAVAAGRHRTALIVNSMTAAALACEGLAES